MAIPKGYPRHGTLRIPARVYIGMSVYLARFLFERGIADKDVSYRVMFIEEIPASQRENPRVTHWVHLVGVSFRVTNTMVRVPYRPKSTEAKK